jgi:hypothetical protein
VVTNQNLLAIPLLLLLLLTLLLDLRNMLLLSPYLIQKWIQKVGSPVTGFQTMRRMQPTGKGKSGKLLVDISMCQITEFPHSSKDTSSKWK